MTLASFSHQLRTTAFSTLAGFHWVTGIVAGCMLASSKRVAGNVDEYRGDRQVREGISQYQGGIKKDDVKLGDIQNGPNRENDEKSAQIVVKDEHTK
jgi:hypothetical protein